MSCLLPNSQMQESLSAPPTSFAKTYGASDDEFASVAQQA